MGSEVMQDSSGVNQKAIDQKGLRPPNVANVALALKHKNMYFFRCSSGTNLNAKIR